MLPVHREREYAAVLEVRADMRDLVGKKPSKIGITPFTRCHREFAMPHFGSNRVKHARSAMASLMVDQLPRFVGRDRQSLRQLHGAWPSVPP